ncbi:MAG TPA: M48 family metallopeptidase [Gemmatimonadaceae bacterium]|nr:M48 family metallopeptidase [Gemmatimonadaceae bacterium]
MRRALATRTMALAAAATLAACAISTQQEVEMGRTYAQQINAQLPIVQDPEINRYVNVLGDSIARLADDRNLEWQFYVVNAPEVNAFAVPGGFIYVNRGLIERTDNLAQLAGVLGHEIAHVTERHSAQQMEQMQRANVGVTLACILTSICQSDAAAAAIQVGGAAVFASFSRNDEREADREAIRNVMRAGIHPQGIPQMFAKLLEERSRSPAGVEAWFSTHPLEEDRITSTQAQIAEIQPILLEGLTVDTPAFRQFKARLRSLPAAAAR